MKLKFFSSLSALLTITLMFPAQSIASPQTGYTAFTKKQDSKFVQKSNGVMPYLRVAEAPKPVRTIASVDTYSMDAIPVQTVSQPLLEEAGEEAIDIINSDAPDPQAADVEVENEQRAWIGDTHFPAIYNVALYQAGAE